MEAQKVYLCTGVGEFIPTYDPSKNKYGCMARSLFLQHRLKVLVSLLFFFLCMQSFDIREFKHATF